MGGHEDDGAGVDVRRMPLAAEPGGRLLNRAGMCEHARFMQGGCPSAANEVAVSADRVTADDTPFGSSIEVAEFDGTVSSLETAPRTPEVIGPDPESVSTD